MGISYHVYLGPYFECEYKIEKTQRFEQVCKNQRCIDYDKPVLTNFCGICGKQSTRISYEIEKSNVNSWDIVNEIGEVLMPIPLEYIELDPYHIWVPNVTRNPPRRFRYNPHTDYCVEPLGRANFHLSEVMWLAESFMEEMKVLKKHYKECLGQWGLIIYPY